jgi:hypothetical protein
MTIKIKITRPLYLCTAWVKADLDFVHKKNENDIAITNHIVVIYFLVSEKKKFIFLLILAN